MARSTGTKTQLTKKAPTARKASVRKNTNPMKRTLVANHTRRDIIIPRSKEAMKGNRSRINLPSVVFPSGTATPIDTEIWRNIKTNNQMIQKYLDFNLLTEVTQAKGIVATMGTTSELVPPEHLQTPDELEHGVMNTRTEREIAGEITI